MASITIKPGREKSLLLHHPWVFSGAVQRVEGSPASGATVDLLAFDGAFLARGAYSPASQIIARVWTFNPGEAVEASFFRDRLRRAIQSRRASSGDTSQAGRSDAARLIYAESDGLPGLIVDRYADVLVLQSLTAGSESWKETLADLLIELTGLKVIVERSDVEVRSLEGLPGHAGMLRGEIASPLLTITENDLQFRMNLLTGHKTGFYLDQALNRLRLRPFAANRRVLDCFCYTGGFTVNALQGGAESVLSVDASADALELCCSNVALNGLDYSRHSTLEGDVFSLLRKFRDEARSFDLIVLDPPKFAPTAALAHRAARGYKDINRLAFKLLAPGGVLFTFSCSGGIDASLFQKIVASAALDAGAEAQILEHLEPAPDHPVALNFPEGAYLKGLVCRKIS